MNDLPPEVYETLVFCILSGDVLPREVNEYEVSPLDKECIFAYVQLALDRIKLNRGQRRALPLLRSYLTTEQRCELRRYRRFTVIGSDGGEYAIRPHYAGGIVAALERHGKNLYAIVSFCFHDRDDEMPPGDVALASMLHIMTDETGFLRAAHWTDHADMLWNGGYLRRLRQARAA